MIEFHLPITPPKATSQTAGRRMFIPKDAEGRVTGRPMFFKNQKAQSAENDLTLLCAQYRPNEPIQGAITLKIDFVFPWRKSEPKKRIALGSAPHTSKPDCSNLVKMIEDCLTKLGFWTDDGQVADLHVTKDWGDRVGISVAISEIQVSTTQTMTPKSDHPSLF